KQGGCGDSCAAAALRRGKVRAGGVPDTMAAPCNQHGPVQGAAMEFENIKFEVANHLATLTINRPDKMNAIDAWTMAEVRQALKHVNVTPDIRALLVTGAGRAFCSGADLSGDSPKAGLNPSDPNERLRDFFAPAVGLLRDLSIPTIAAVNGAAAGAG